MKRKEYIQKAKELILKRIKFHAPILYDDDIDEKVLKQNGIDSNMPVFKFEKKLNKRLIKAFELAQRECDFNLLFSFDSLGRIGENSLRKLKNCIVYSKYSSMKLLENINKLNVNYFSNSNYDIKFSEKYCKINNLILNPQYENFSLSQKGEENGILYEYKEFLLNGNNTFIKFVNTTDIEQKIELEFNFPLKNGYYFFKKHEKYIEIENISTKEKMFFNFHCKNAKFDFSAVDGLENSRFSCVNLKINLKIKPKNINFVFFNFGKDIFNFNNFVSVNNFYQLSVQKCCEIFDVRVKTKNFCFDNMFNIDLPKKIWTRWANFDNAENLMDRYQSYRKLFVVGKNKYSFMKFGEIGLREILVFNGKRFKKIVIVSSDESFLQIGLVHFYGTKTISKKSLQSVEPISLSFGRG